MSELNKLFDLTWLDFFSLEMFIILLRSALHVGLSCSVPIESY